MHIDVTQSTALGGLGVAEGDVFKVDGAVFYFHHRIFGVAQFRLFLQQLIGTIHGSPADG